MAATPRAEPAISKTHAKACGLAHAGGMLLSGMLLICGLLLCCSLAIASAFAQTPVATERKTVPPPKAPSDPPPMSPPMSPANALPKPPSIELRAGEYLWMPQLAPKGPVVTRIGVTLFW